jgi:hypothetical protein
MNIIQMHERARFLLDVVATSRFESEDLDNALNGEIDQIVREKYDQSRIKNRSDAFERTQRVRDELGPLIREIDESNPGLFVYLGTNGSFAIVSFVDFLGDNQTIFDFRYLLSMTVLDIDGIRYPVFPISRDEFELRNRNPFRRERAGEYPKFYYIDSGLWYTKWEVRMALGSDANFDNLFLTYLRDPLIVSYGTERDSSYTFANGTEVIAIEPTVYASANYVIGEKFTITNPNYSITSGLVAHNFVDSDLPNSLHEEISRRAAASLLISAGESEKAKEILSQIIST